MDAPAPLHTRLPFEVVTATCQIRATVGVNAARGVARTHVLDSNPILAKTTASSFSYTML